MMMERNSQAVSWSTQSGRSVSLWQSLDLCSLLYMLLFRGTTARGFDAMRDKKKNVDMLKAWITYRSDPYLIEYIDSWLPTYLSIYLFIYSDCTVTYL